MKRIALQGARIYYEPGTDLDGESYWVKAGEGEDDALEMYLLDNGWLEVVYNDHEFSEYHSPHMVLWARKSYHE